jgi:hypothetical protein
MAISTAAELATAISNWLDVASGNFATNQVTDLVMLGEKWILRNVRSPEMETALSVTIANGVATAPTGFLGLKYAYVDGSPTKKLVTKTPDQILSAYPTRASSGKPAWIAYDAGNFIFGPYPDSTYTIKGTYYKRVGPLSSSAYDLFTNNPDLYLFAALAEAEMVIGRDQRVPMWKAKRDEIAAGVNRDAFGIAAGGGLAMTAA